MRKDTILVIGANGQIGSVLTQELRKIYGSSNVIASDIRLPKEKNAPFEQLDILKATDLAKVIDKYKINQIFHLAAILSAKGEKNPKLAWDLNMNSLFNVLEVAKEKAIDKIFFPSSIAVFGSKTPRVSTPQQTILHAETVYGISKVAGESWAEYYHAKFGIDIRSLRYPGIIGHQSLAGGGTTDYAVDIFHKAAQNEDYICFLKKDTRLPMMYMEDAIRATLQLMDAPAEQIKIRSSYNIAGMDFTPAELTLEIQKQLPDFKTVYAPDFRQAIADSWPESIDDTAAQQDWNWAPKYDISSMTKDMLSNLIKRYQQTENIHP